MIFCVYNYTNIYRNTESCHNKDTFFVTSGNLPCLYIIQYNIVTNNNKCMIFIILL